MSERKLFQKQDIILVSALLALALAILCAYSIASRGVGDKYCQITYDGKPVQTVSLSENRVFALEQNPHVRFEIKDNAIAFIESDCPDKVCVHSGYLSLPNQMAACLPNRVSIKIAASGHNDADMIAN